MYFWQFISGPPMSLHLERSARLGCFLGIWESGFLDPFDQPPFGGIPKEVIPFLVYNKKVKSETSVAKQIWCEENSN